MVTVVESVEQKFSCLQYGLESREQYLHQYSILVNQFYKKDLDLDLAENHMDGRLEQAGPGEFFYIVRDGEQVVAGAKMSFSSRNSKLLLPMEEGHFRVGEFLPEGYGNQIYAEIGRLVVDPGYRGKDVLQTMVSELAGFARSHGCGYLFVLAPALNAVLYRRICRSLGMPIELHKDAGLPDKALYRRLDIKFLSSDIREFYSANSRPGEHYSIAV